MQVSMKSAFKHPGRIPYHYPRSCHWARVEFLISKMVYDSSTFYVAKQVPPPKKNVRVEPQPPKTADPLVSTRFTPQTTTGNYCAVVASSSSSAFQLIDRIFFREIIVASFFQRGKKYFHEGEQLVHKIHF